MVTLWGPAQPVRPPNLIWSCSPLKLCVCGYRERTISHRSGFGAKRAGLLWIHMNEILVQECTAHHKEILFKRKRQMRRFIVWIKSKLLSRLHNYPADHWKWPHSHTFTYWAIMAVPVAVSRMHGFVRSQFPPSPPPPPFPIDAGS